MPDPTDVARLRAVSKGMHAAVAATKRKVQEPYQEEAVAKGYLSIVKRMHAQGRLSRVKFLCAAAAGSGQLEALKALRAENSPWNEWTCTIAARRGHLHVLTWARENGCPWDEETRQLATEQWPGVFA